MIFGVKAHMTVGNLNIGMTGSYPVQDPSGPRICSVAVAV
jgi:hypothetical protein